MQKFYSPELENLKKSLLAHTWYKSPYEELFKEQYARLQQPITQQQINLARENILGATKAGIQEAQKALGTRGFLTGQSGVADRAIQDVLRSGQTALGQAIGNIATQQELASRQLTNQLLESMGQLASYGVKNIGDILGTAGGLEAQQQQFDLNKLLSFLQLLQSYYSGEQESQLARYSPYWRALETIYKG